MLNLNAQAEIESSLYVSTTKVSIVNLFNFYNDLAVEIKPELMVMEPHVKVSLVSEYLTSLSETERLNLEGALNIIKDIEGTIGHEFRIETPSQLIDYIDDDKFKVYEYIYDNACAQVTIFTVMKDKREMVMELELTSPYDRVEQCGSYMTLTQYMYLGSILQFTEGVRTKHLFNSIYESLKAEKPYKSIVDGVSISAGFRDGKTLVLFIEPEYEYE
ncbi:hypothetical protein [Vibrio cyclitrophicus]|uniref:hypothetical protein n=1 Tax=Vibrio cyclitrophicus TaxID=47951 RepID=UPI0032E4BB34